MGTRSIVSLATNDSYTYILNTEAAKVQEGICWADRGLGGSAVHGREERTRDSERRLRQSTAETERQVTASVDVLKERGCRRACVGLRRLRTWERRADHIFSILLKHLSGLLSHERIHI